MTTDPHSFNAESCPPLPVNGMDFFDLLTVPMVLLDLQGLITWTNRAWLNETISPNIPPGQPGVGLHFGRDVLSVTETVLHDVLTQHSRLEKDLCAPDNTTWWRAILEHIGTGVLVMFMPITDLQGDYQLLDSVSVGVVRTSVDGMVEWSNSIYAQMRDGNHDQGESLWRLLGHIKEWRPPRGIETSGPSEVWLPNGQAGTWVQVHTRPITCDHTLVGHLATLCDVSDRIELRRQAEKAWIDELTGLANRRGLKRALEQVQIMREGTCGRSMAFMVIDLNDFKIINDQRGHKVGDDVLYVIATRLKAIVRSNDTPARLGGDEFAVLLPYATKAEAIRVAKRVNLAFSRPVMVGREPLIVSAAIGVVLTQEDRSFDELLMSADDAMYRSKKNQSEPTVVEMQPVR